MGRDQRKMKMHHLETVAVVVVERIVTPLLAGASRIPESVLDCARDAQDRIFPERVSLRIVQSVVAVGMDITSARITWQLYQQQGNSDSEP